jgi:predicted nucleic acid-binding protein
MTALVLDASIALSWCFNDEASRATWELLEMLQAESAVVPAIWSLEIGNILSNAERNGRLTEAKIFEFLDLLGQLNIEIDLETSTRAFRETLHISRRHLLSTYDAAYLELAMRLGIPLASKDKKLRQVCNKLGVKVLPSSLRG